MSLKNDLVTSVAFCKRDLESTQAFRQQRRTPRATELVVEHSDSELEFRAGIPSGNEMGQARRKCYCSSNFDLVEKLSSEPSWPSWGDLEWLRR